MIINHFEQHRQEPCSSSDVHYREQNHDVVFTPVAVTDYDLGVAAAFKRIGAEYDELCIIGSRLCAKLVLVGVQNW